MTRRNNNLGGMKMKRESLREWCLTLISILMFPTPIGMGILVGLGLEVLLVEYSSIHEYSISWLCVFTTILVAFMIAKIMQKFLPKLIQKVQGD